MLERLIVASKALEVTLNAYLKTIQDIQGYYVDGQPINNIPAGIAASLAEQLPIMKSFKEKLELARVDASRSANSSSSLVRLNILPSDILIRIFKRALGDNLNCINNPTKSPPGSPNLLKLMGICSYWRQMIINSPSFWNHIDLVARDDYAGITPIEYAKSCAIRAGKMSLDIHITNHIRGFPPDYDTPTTSLISFIASIAPRIGSLTFDVGHPNLYRKTLTTLFENCIPGFLTTLSLRALFYKQVVLTEDIEYHEEAVLANIPNERLEEIFRGVTTLRLSSIYPSRWTSSAYHGLVELRLRKGLHSELSEAQFVGALRQSPGLRILECAIHLGSPLDLGEQVDPIPLNDLEVVNLGRHDFPYPHVIVRWLAPGQKALQVLLTATFLGPELLAFFSRSKITKLYHHQGSLTCPMYFLRHLPLLQTLALGKRRELELYGQPKQTIESALVSCPLETLYVTNLSSFSLEPLRRVLSLQSLRRVVFYRCLYGSTEDFREMLSALNRPQIEFVVVSNDESDPVGGWELLCQGLHEF